MLRGARLLSLAVLLGAVTACAARGPAVRPTPAPPPPASPPTAASLVDTALSLNGTPYRSGGADPSGFDCSGLVAYVFGRHGLRVPRNVAGLFLAGAPVRDTQVKAADLVFFRTAGSGITHVGIALGDGRFVHAPSTSGSVRVEALSSRYWRERFAGARRLVALPPP